MTAHQLEKQLLLTDLDLIVEQVEDIRVSDSLKAEAQQAGLPVIAQIEAEDIDELLKDVIEFRRRWKELYG